MKFKIGANHTVKALKPCNFVSHLASSLPPGNPDMSSIESQVKETTRRVEAQDAEAAEPENGESFNAPAGTSDS